MFILEPKSKILMVKLLIVLVQNRAFEIIAIYKV